MDCGEEEKKEKVFSTAPFNGKFCKEVRLQGLETWATVRSSVVYKDPPWPGQ